jgi:acyl carrier protein
MTTLDQVKSLLGDVLQLGERRKDLEAQTPLLGSLPELDSMAVATVIAGVEERFGVFIEDDEINADVFRTVGTLTDFVEKKLTQ